MDQSNVDTEAALHNGTKPRRTKTWRVILVLVIVCIVFGIIYYIFFRAHDVGKRSVALNGENVEEMDGFTVRSETWLQRAEVTTFLSHIGATSLSLPAKTRTYNGVPYIRANDLVRALNQFGDKSSMSGNTLAVALKAGQHYSYQYNGDTIRQEAVIVNGHRTGWILAVEHQEATYVPVGTTSTLLMKAGVKSSWNGNVLNLLLSKKASPVPIERPTKNRVIEFGNGKAIYAPNYAWQGATYLPVFSISTAMDQLGFTSTVGPWQWTITSQGQGSDTNTQTGSGTVTLPASSKKQKPMVLGFVTSYYAGDIAAFNDVIDHPSSYNALAADAWSIDAGGGLTGSVPAGEASQAATQGDKVYAMITNLDSNSANAKQMTAILGSSSKVNQLEDDITNVVTANDYDGAMLDLEGIAASNRTSFTNFVTNLAKSLHAQGKQLAVVIPAKTDSTSEPWSAAFDEAKIGEAADDVIVMAYDYSYAGGPAGPIAPVPWVQQTLAYTVSRVPAHKVILGIDTYGYDWAGKKTTAVSLSSVDSFLASHHITPKWNSTAEAPWYQWTDSQGTTHTVYYENAKSTQAKINLTQSYGIAGVAMWRAGLEDSSIRGVLAQYAKGQ